MLSPPGFTHDELQIPFMPNGCFYVTQNTTRAATVSKAYGNVNNRCCFFASGKVGWLHYLWGDDKFDVSTHAQVQPSRLLHPDNSIN
jgi:hypothetical protein